MRKTAVILVVLGLFYLLQAVSTADIFIESGVQTYTNLTDMTFI